MVLIPRAGASALPSISVAVSFRPPRKGRAPSTNASARKPISGSKKRPTRTGRPTKPTTAPTARHHGHNQHRTKRYDTSAIYQTTRPNFTNLHATQRNRLTNLQLRLRRFDGPDSRLGSLGGGLRVEQRLRASAGPLQGVRVQLAEARLRRKREEGAARAPARTTDGSRDWLADQYASKKKQPTRKKNLPGLLCNCFCSGMFATSYPRYKQSAGESVKHQRFVGWTPRPRQWMAANKLLIHERKLPGDGV